MICAFCNKESAKIGWDETSHLGKRPICYACIGERDVRKMRKSNTIVLRKEGNKVTNQVGSFSFRILEEKKINNGTHFFFLFEKKRWEGIMHSEHSEFVACRKYKSSTI